jgi:hypothetical protein
VAHELDEVVTQYYGPNGRRLMVASQPGALRTLEVLAGRASPTHTRNEYFGKWLKGGVDGRIAVESIPSCRKCKVPTFGFWVKRIKADGRREAQLRCITCAHLGKAVGERKFGSIATLPLWGDSRDGTVCEKCDYRGGVQEHHWSPGHLFESKYDWPTSMLCIDCHRYWHDMATPTRRRRETRIKSVKTHYWQTGGSRPGHCEHCHSPNDVREHYWAPEDIFDEWWAWPSSRLCGRCAATWRGAIDEARALAAS